MPGPVITVVGSFAVGMTLRTSRMPAFGETLLGSDFDMGPGGKGSNQAVAAARLGAQSHFAGMVGEDGLGDLAIDLYRAEGVDSSHLHRTRQMATGVGFIILNKSGENGIVIDMGANKLMDASFVESVESQIAHSAIVMTVLEIPLSAAMKTIELSKKHGVPNILNPAPATRVDDAVLQSVDYLTPNETELRVLLGLSPEDPTPTPELAARLHDQGVKNLIVTRAEKGALVFSGSENYEVPGVALDTIVDTTGAGDAFNAGLAVALAEGMALANAVQFACCSGALACTRLGVIPALARREQVDQLFRRAFL